MQAPYLAITWNVARGDAASAAAAAADDVRAAGWRCGLARPGLQAWVRADRPVPMAWSPVHRALIIGRRRVHRDGCAAPLAGLAEARARRLCADGWGSYVALIEGDGDGPWWAFRDPSGAVEAFAWPIGPLDVVTASFDSLPVGFQPHDLSIDWGVLADYVRRPTSQSLATPLHGPRGLWPGAAQPLGEGDIRSAQVWRPVDWIPSDAEPDPGWPERLAETTLCATTELLRPYGRMVTEASGGLDSSIVNAAVAHAGLAGRVVAALHYVGDRREADERVWAVALARRLDLPLHCVARTPDAAFDPEWDFAELARDIRPPLAALDAVRDRDTADQVRGFGADALVTGKGGDALFFQMPSSRVLSDLWREHGWAALGDPRSAEIAHWLRRSLWQAWAEAWQQQFPPDASRLGRFAGWALKDLPTRASHPWLDGLETAPFGKQLQIRALTGGHAAIGASRRTKAADVVQPLLSQPLMELCLSIPSWELVRGGRDRGLAREAFAPWLPEPIILRRSKGALTSIYARRAAAGADALRAHLLDGVLASAGLLDAKAIARALEPDALMQSLDGADLLSAAALESWVRYWQTRVADRPSARRFPR